MVVNNVKLATNTPTISDNIIFFKCGQKLEIIILEVDITIHDRVAISSKLYLTVKGIIMQSLKS